MSRIGQLRPWLWLAGIAAIVTGVCAMTAAVPWSSDTARRRVIQTLSERLDGEVELAALQLRFLPSVHIVGAGLVVRHKGRRDVPPLIAVATLQVDATLPGLLRKHVGQVTLGGLEINITPHRKETDEEHRPDRGGGVSLDASGDVRELVIDNLVSADARLNIIPEQSDKAPKVWTIHTLHMRSVSVDRAMPFDATLTNAIPPGEIRTRGSFGPWQAGDPGATPVEGTFTFADADLGVFKGISGTLSAHGEFGGTLGRLSVHGETETPQFTVAVGGHPVPLHTDYHATVDGTNGDTVLDRIDGSFLATSLVAKGRVVDTPGKDGRTVTLDVEMDQARIEDVLRLAVKAPRPPMTGALTLKTTLVLPPGERDVVEKLRLEGQFSIARAKFTNVDIQKKVDELSHRGRGRSVDDRKESVVSNFQGRFRLANAVLGLKALGFETPGAQVHLAGTYGLRSEQLAFKGSLSLKARMSDTQRGVKRLLLKVIDPLFEGEHGGTVIPIKIEGTRTDPSFGLDKGRLFKRGR